MVVKRKPKPLLIIIALLLLLILVTLGCWTYLTSPVDKESNVPIVVVIPEGSGIK